MRYRIFLVLLILALFFSGCIQKYDNSAESPRIKNIIFMIGDGMGPQQLGLLTLYAHFAPNSIYPDRKCALEKVMAEGVIGLAYHVPADALVTDSAASGTQIASGEWAGANMIGCDKKGNPVVTILEKAEALGKSTGLVTNTRITHATPAAFAAHQPQRSKENEIAVDILNNDVDVIFGGGLRHWIPQDVKPENEQYYQLKIRTRWDGEIKSKRKDDRNLLEEAEAKGYEIIFNIDQLNSSQNAKILGLFANSSLMNGIQETIDVKNPDRKIPTLLEMTKKAVETLSKDEDGFFLMIEGGQIDWAGHDNDAGTLLHEMIHFDETVDYVFKWAQKRRDTIVIISADHETGGFSFCYSPWNPPAPKQLPGSMFKDEMFSPKEDYGTYDILDKIYSQRMSFAAIFEKFDKLPNEIKSAKALADIVNDNMDFKITVDEAGQILSKQLLTRPGIISEESKLDDPSVPMNYPDVYFYGKDIRKGMLARYIGRYQMVSWASGVHSHTPVPLIVYGPRNTAEKFSGMMHTTEWADIAIEILMTGR